MGVNVAREVAAMWRMTVPELKRRYTEVFGEECRSRHKWFLVKRIAWRLQANAEGALSEQARRRTFSYRASITRYGYRFPSGRDRQAEIWVSRSTTSAETWLRLTSRPHNSSVIRWTLRVETPCRYISTNASTNAFSLRWYRSNSSVRNRPWRSCGTNRSSVPTRVLSARGL